MIRFTKSGTAIMAALLISVAAPAYAAEKRSYSPERYMTATGTGKTEEEARNRALAELSRIFESKVESETIDRIKAVTGPQGQRIDQQVESRVKVTSAVELKGAEIGGVWFDDGKRLYYAVAALERQPARDNWLRQLRDADMAIEGKFKAYENASSRLIKLKTLYGIVDLWVDREVTASRLRVLGGWEEEFPVYDMRVVFVAMPEIKSTMPIFVEVEGEGGETLRAKVSEALGRAGYVMAGERAEADVLISGELTVKPVEVKEIGWKYARAKAVVSIKDPKAGISIGEVSESKRAGHLSYSEASDKAVKAISDDIARGLIKYLKQAD